ncbi:MAG: small subunit ribosomal protein [Actinobacteria bacterium]|nr:MAG: small subunit ribosomal protein [Actinomycetota bacterium]MDO8950916.1 30S ribosomal protein S2 [Actinomycetota bacterium]
MAAVSMKALLEAGVHFGHQTRRWNPKMKPYIFTERNGIYILDLQRSLREIDATYRFVRDLTARGGSVLFIGTKKQAQEPVSAEATRSSMPFVNQRWLGGMLTNFVTIRKRIARMVELETMETNGVMASLPKKEALKKRGELEKLQKNLNGIRDMHALPDAVFIIDTKKEAIAIAEARRLHIPIIGLVDTNADPDEVDFVIPGNDDAIRAVGLICRVIADAAVDGRGAAGLTPEAPVADAAAANAVEAVEAPVAAAEPAAAVEAEVVAEPAVEAEVVAEETAPEAADAE